MNLIFSSDRNKSLTILLILGGLLIFLTPIFTPVASAQGLDTNWTRLYPLSSQTGQVGDQIIFADPFGYVHLFWPETGLLADRSLVYYSRFDGETWSSPVDILLAPFSTEISASVDLEGILHLMFTNRNSGNVYYTKASVRDATSAQGWQKPRQLDISAKQLDFKVDSNGVFHCLYSGFAQSQPGVYYTRSDDNGQTWSRSFWLDPDIPPDLAPGQIQLELGKDNSLHAVWFYWDQAFLGRWIRYSHSFDQGKNWSVPTTIDEVEAGSTNLRLPSPSMFVNDEDVHIIWAGDDTTHRKHRLSHESGRSWNQAEFIFGDLHGQAIGDGLAVDTLGRLHFLGQLRWPQGVYHAYWHKERWSSPIMIYLIAQNAFESIGERVHAHKVRAAIRAGNQLVVTFTSSPSDPQMILYTMHRTMQDVPVFNILALPEHIPLPTLDTQMDLVSPTLLPDVPTETTTKIPSLDTNFDPIPPSSGLIRGILPAVLLIVSIVIIRVLIKKNE